VVVNALPIADAGTDHNIVQGSYAQLQGAASGGTGDYSYQWSPSSQCISPTTPSTQTADLFVSTIFELHVTNNNNGCVSYPDSSIVYVNGGPLIVQAYSNTNNACSGESINLMALAGGGTGNYTYTWTSLPAGFFSSSPSQIVTPLVSTLYIVDVTDGIEFVSDTVSVNIFPLPQTYLVSEGGSYCQGGDGVDINLSGSDIGIHYSLFYQQSMVDDKLGTGQLISFNDNTQQGEYSIIANPDQACYGQMNGIATVTSVSLPVTNAGDNQIVSMQGQTQLFGSVIGGTGNYLYNWNPSGSLINPQYKEPLTIPLHSTTLFNLGVIDASSGCLGIDDQTVVFVTGGPLTTSIYSSNTDICQGQETQLFALASGGSGNYTYLWLSEPPGFTSNIYNPVVQPDASTTYTVIIGDGTSSASDSIIVNVSISPIQYNLLGGGIFCENNDGLEINLSGSQETSNYELFNNNGSTGVIIPGSGDEISFGIQSIEGYYWVVGTEYTLGCTSNMLDTVQIEEAELPIANGGEDQFVEEGNSTTLNGSATGGAGYYGYNWYPDYLLIDPSVQNPTTVPLYTSTLYNLVVEDQDVNCFSYPDTTIVYITNLELSINVSASPDIVCEGETVFLSAMPTGGTGNYTYNWYSNPSGLYSNLQFPVVNPIINTTYIVEINDGDTLLIDSVIVEVVTSPIIFEVVGGGSYCKYGEGVGISLSGSQKEKEYTLIRNQNIEVSTVVGSGGSIDFGIYRVDGNYTVRAGSVETGCYQQMAGSVTVSQYPQPIADAGSDIVISPGNYTTLNGSASGGLGEYDYLWSPSEKLINPGDPDATTVPLTKTTLFTLQVTDELTNCVSDPSNMIVIIQGGPIMVEIVTDKNQVCPGQQVSLLALPGGGIGSYNYFWESIPTGFNATAQEVNVVPESDTWYKVTVTNGDQITSDSMYISTFPIPESFDLLGGGGYCEGSGGVDILLEGSKESIIYTLYHNTISTGNYIIGSGSQISFGNQLLTGNYSVFAINNYGCSSLMNNVVQVKINQLPEKYSLYGGGTYCENDPALGLLLESSQQDVDYELYKDGSPTGITELGSGLPIGFVGFDGTGLYSVVATGAGSGCVNTMLGVSGLIINDIPNISISGPDRICAEESIILSGTGGYTYEWNCTTSIYTIYFYLT